jgi:enoyl-CoA hydratase/carnithine racemase
MCPLVDYAVSDGVAVITLNRPDRLNAWTHELGRQYLDLVQRAGDDDQVRAIVVTGAGRGFCAGADMDGLSEIGPGNHPQQVDTRPQTLPRTVPKPFIAAINGACAGVGMVIALACDIRFAAPGIKLTTAFARRGLIAEYGISWLLSRLVGPSRALDLLLSARTLMSEEAAELCLVDRVIAMEEGTVLDAALAYARDLAALSSPTSMAVIKGQVMADLERGLAEGYAEAELLMHESMDAPDLAEGVASFMERRPPRFPPLDPGRARVHACSDD